MDLAIIASRNLKVLSRCNITFTLVFLFLVSFTNLIGQSIHINSDEESYHLYDRTSILHGGSSHIHSSIKNIERKDLVDYYNGVYHNSPSELEKARIRHFVINNQEFLHSAQEKNEAESNESYNYIDSSKTFYTVENEKEESMELEKTTSNPILKYFYHSPGKLYELDKKSFKLSLNPILNINGGIEQDNDSPVFINLRGLELSGSVDNKVYFYANIHETQQLFNNYTEDWIRQHKAVPGAGFYKNYQSGVADRLKGWDFLKSQAYVGLKVSKHINLEFGHGRHFVGNGKRSLLLSDFSNNYFYLKFNTQVWKFNYQNIFAELSSLSAKSFPGDVLIPKKYFAAHYLSYKILKNLELGIFETIVFSRENHFELQYLNPLILYRTAEQLVGSPDNILLGLNANWNIYKRFSIYGQVVFDEFKLKELLAQEGWWGNKYGIQVGGKYINVANIDQLDLQVEYNIVRPFTYSHGKLIEGTDKSISSYSNYSQPLAHPRGANFKELLVMLKYKPLARLSLDLNYMHTMYGESYSGVDGFFNQGENILLPNGTRMAVDGYEIGDGIATDVDMISFHAGYELFQNYYIDLNYIYRNQTSEHTFDDIKTSYIGGGVRVNIGQVGLDY